MSMEYVEYHFTAILFQNSCLKFHLFWRAGQNHLPSRAWMLHCRQLRSTLCLSIPLIALNFTQLFAIVSNAAMCTDMPKPL